MKKVVFVVLHYCTLDVTTSAIQCILDKIQYENYEIVVVDNASPDGSGKVLQKRYHQEPRIHMIFNEQNVGYARGTNCGYLYAREKLDAEFVVIINSDVRIEQEDFIQRVIEIYGKEKCYILGPDIVTNEEKHQNPHRLKPFDIKDVNRIIRNRTIILLYLKIKKILRLERYIKIVERWDAKKEENEKRDIEWNKQQKNVVLHGSCLIFTPLYLESENEAFCPKTFMWMEEDILAWFCKKKGYDVIYTPKLKVFHHEGVSTNINRNQEEKFFFYSSQLRTSAKIMKDIMTEKL